jgi:Ribosomal protein S7p/S5e
MMKGRNNGKKLLAVRIVAHAFEIIHLLTDQNPIQVRLRSCSAFMIRFFNVFPKSRSLSMPLSTLDLVKTLHVSALKVLFVARLLMFRLCGE